MSTRGKRAKPAPPPKPVVEYNDERHEYRVGGEIWPSVSAVIERLQMFNGIPKDVLEAAARFGRHVHAACHLDNIGALDWGSLDPALRPYVTAWRQWQIDFDAVIEASEIIVVSERYRYCGRLDVKARVYTKNPRKERREIIDYKATSAIPRTVGPQSWAYLEALGDDTCRRRVVQLREDGTYRSKLLADGRDGTHFVSALNLYNWFASQEVDPWQ